MYNTPPPNLLQGIHLVQAGRKNEALTYLRYAARHETMTADGWLWLAAATPDRDEYRHSVYEALRLDPRHPTALRMREEIERQDRWGYAAAGAGYTERATWAEGQALAAARPSRLRRVLGALAVLIVIGGLAGGGALLARSGAIQDRLDEWFSSAATYTTLTFTVGSQPGYTFRAEVPESWRPADRDDPDWRAARDGLIATFPVPADQVSVWAQVEAPFGQATVDPVYGLVLPNARLVETDTDLLERYGVVTSLALSEIMPLPPAPEGQPDTVCDRMRALEESWRAAGAASAAPGSEVIEASLAKRADLDDCVLYIHRRFTDLLPQQVPFPVTLALAPDATRSIVIAVPVGADRYAKWTLTLADSAYSRYDNTINTIISSLAFVPGN